MCSLWYFETQGQERFQLFLIVLHYFRKIFGQFSLNFQKWGVGEKKERLSIREWAFD